MSKTDASTEATNGELPEGWESPELLSLLETSIGGIWGTEPGESEVDVDVIRVTELKAHGRIEPSTAARRSITEKQLSSRQLREGDLLLEKSGGGPNTPVGRVGLVPRLAGRSVCSNFMQLMRPDLDRIDGNFLHHFLTAFHANSGTIALQTATTNIRNIKASEYLATPIPLPARAEQERIVEILEEQLSRLDAALESVRVVREKAAQFRRSLLHAAFSGALTGHNPEDGELPEGWVYLPLGELATLSLGKMLDRKQFTGMHPVPYLRNINVRWDRFDLGDLQEMDITPAQLDRVSLCAGDLVVCEGGEPGRAAVWGGTESIAIQKALHRVRPVDRIKPRFLYFAFEAEFRGVEDHPLFTGTTIKHLPKEKIAAVMVPLPPLEEQERIVQILEEQLSRLDAALAVADVIEKRSAALRRSLLHAAFTGRLTEQWRESVHV